MKVAFVRPPNQSNQVRGVGFYAERLLEALSKIPDLEIEWLNYTQNPFAYQKYDIVHFPYFDFFNLSLPPLRISRTIVTVHDAIPLKFPTHFPQGKKAKTIWPIQKKILSKVDAIITDSQASRVDIKDLTNVPKEKINVTYLAPDQAFKEITDAASLSMTRKKFNLPHDFVLYVGGVNWNKNVAALLKAYDGNIVLVGKEFTKVDVDLTHEELQPFKEILSLVRERGNVTRLGFVETPDLAAVYNLATVYVQPSIYEGFGLPVLESLACGTLTISGRGGSLKEIGGEAVIYADVENQSDLKAKIAHVLNLTQKEKTNLQKKGLDQAAKFTWQKCSQETYAIYQKVLERV